MRLPGKGKEWEMTSYATDEKGHDEYVALLEQQNATLLAALELVLAHEGKLTGADWATIRAAIAQAKGQETEEEQFLRSWTDIGINP
jgi:hypothetical protein